MNINSSRSRFGTNFYHNLDRSGQIEIKDGKERYIYYIAGGTISGYDEYQGRRKTRELRYGKYLKAWENGRLTHDHTIRPGTICSIIPRVHYEKIPATLYGQAGTVILKWYGGSLRGETFKYKGKRVPAYEIKRGTKAAKAGFTVLSPDGRIYAKYTGEINFSYTGGGGLLLNHKTGGQNSWTKIPKSEFIDLEKIDRLFDGRNYAVEVYDQDFKITLAGRVESGQKVDKWISKGKEVYYIQGVEISAKLYNAKPEQLDPQEVLAISNSQVRAAFVKKIGFERIIQKIGGKVIATDPRGYELIELPCGTTDNNRVDPVIRLLKVKCPSTGAFYTLRVPPRMENCEQARQWTFGLNDPTPENAKQEYFDLEKET